MKRICAWCKEELFYPQGEKDGPITHGICPACADKIRDELETIAQTVEAPEAPRGEA